MKADPLHFKIFSDESVKIDSSSENISADAARTNALDLERAAKFVENVERKEGDLSFVILFVIEIAVAAQSSPGNAFERLDLDHREIVRFPAVMPFKIMAR